MLGRGLESLIPNKNKHLVPESANPTSSFVIPTSPPPVERAEAGILTTENQTTPNSDPVSTSFPQALETSVNTVDAPVRAPMPEPLENLPVSEPLPEIVPEQPLIPEPKSLPVPELVQFPVAAQTPLAVIPVSQSFTPTHPSVIPTSPPPVERAEAGILVVSNQASSSEGETQIPSLRSGTTERVNNANGFEDNIYNIPVLDIKPNPHQPRKVFEEEALVDLTNSIRELGIIQPLVVSRVLDKEGVEFFQLIAGERRLTAAKRAGLKTVPAIIKQIKEDRDNLELAIVENIQRADLNPIESARSYAKLQEEFGLTQREIAARMGKSRETIVNVMRLLTLPTYIQEAIGSRQISDSQGRLLLSVPDSQEQRGLFDDILANNLSVRDVKIRLTRMRSKDFTLNQVMAKNQFRNTTPEIAYLENKLQESLGTKVSVQLTNNGGKLLINFFSEDELKNIASRLIQEDPHGEIDTSQA